MKTRKRQKPATKKAPSARKEKSPPDPSKPIKNNRWEAFAQDVFGGMTQYEAYLKNYPVSRKWKRGSVEVEAHKLNTKILHRTDWLKSQVASKKIATKEELAEGYSAMWRTTLADFLEVDQDGMQFVKVTKKSMSVLALKKIKAKKITDEAGNTVMGIHLYELELIDRIAAGKALSALMEYDPKPSLNVHADQETREFLSTLLGTGINATSTK